MKGTLLHIPIEHATYSVKTFTKVYPNKHVHFTYKNNQRKVKEGLELSNVGMLTSQKSGGVSLSDSDLLRSLRRSKTTLTDLVLCNQFDMFATFTFARDRQDVLKCKSRMSNWLKSQQRAHGSFSYLLVPEFHSDGVSLHFHALLKGYPPKNLSDSGKRINNRKAYNINSYKSGFSTVVMIDNVEKVGSYIKKYITKDMPQFDGKKRYWHSRGLLKPDIIEHTPIPDSEPVYENDFVIVRETMLQ